MADRQKGLQRLGAGFGKIGRIFVPKHVEREDKKEHRRRIVSREPFPMMRKSLVRDGGRKAHKNKLAAKRHAARKIAHESRKRNRDA